MPISRALTLPLLAALLPGTLSAAAGAKKGPLAKTIYGSVRGYTENGTKAWRGIPYAASPVGDLRFRPPQAPKPWTGELNATAFGASCWQMGSPGLNHFSDHKAWVTLGLNHTSEDCLFANVYAPAHADAGSKLPVMVYMHAGEFRFGSSNDRESNWPYFAKKNNASIILVTANVRLGLFGFGALKALRSRDPTGSTGNYGMQDQRAVLKFVQSNIKEFGGDPKRVTIFGESSGGTSVAYHLLSKQTQALKLFTGAILESPGLTQSHTWEQSEGNTQFAVSLLTSAGSKGCAWPAVDKQKWQTFDGLDAHGTVIGTAPTADQAKQMCANMTNCALLYVTDGANGATQLLGGGTAGNLTSSGAVFTGNVTQRTGEASAVKLLMRLGDPTAGAPCLLHAAPEDLIACNLGPPNTDTFYTDAAAPTIDGVELKATIAELSRTEIPEGIAVLAGSNLDEGTEFMQLCAAIHCNANTSEFSTWAKAQFGEALGENVPAVYTKVETPSPLCKSKHGGPVNTSAAWVAAMRSAGDYAITCRARELLKDAHKKGSPAYWYHFTATPVFSFNMPDIPYMGAFHGSEVPFVFGDDFELSTKGEHTLSNAMGCYWVNFAASGNPNKGPSGCSQTLKLPEWPSIGASNNVLVMSNTSIAAKPGFKSTQCDLYATYP